MKIETCLLIAAVSLLILHMVLREPAKTCPRAFELMDAFDRCNGQSRDKAACSTLEAAPTECLERRIRELQTAPPPLPAPTRKQPRKYPGMLAGTNQLQQFRSGDELARAVRQCLAADRLPVHGGRGTCFLLICRPLDPLRSQAAIDLVQKELLSTSCDPMVIT